ncbi:hypothetical protein C5E11_03850 [Clavibacter michiganensis]|nr:hypothetical protein [Clavibacter michiganensis]PPF64535.1 hypothetical protein C5E11_03850 [Clavibacter michiganensis]
MRIEFDELMVYGRPDESFDGLGFTSLEGWDDLTDDKSPVEERAQGHGAFDTEKAFRASRVMNMVAFVAAADFRSAQRARQELAAVFARNRILMRVTDEFSSSWRWVRIARANLPRISMSKFVYSVDIVAVDPFRFEDGVPDETGLPTAGTGHMWPMVWPINWGTPGETGRLTLTNEGTAEGWPTFSVHGGLSGGFELEQVGTGLLIRFSQTLLVGSTAVISAEDGTVFVDGVSRSTFLTRRDWFSVGPGETVQVQFRALGATFGTPTAVGLINHTSQ